MGHIWVVGMIRSVSRMHVELVGFCELIYRSVLDLQPREICMNVSQALIGFLSLLVCL
jgi:hypothetical protein